MVKKQNNAWIVYVIAIIAIAALILAALAFSKANMTGNAFWDFLKTNNEKVQVTPDSSTTSGTYGLLGEVYLADGGNFENLINYQVEYDKNGNKMYELMDGGILLVPGEGYKFVKNLEGSYDLIDLIDPEGDSSQGGWKCTGSCSGSNCNQEGCDQEEVWPTNNLACVCAGSGCGNKNCKHVRSSA